MYMCSCMCACLYIYIFSTVHLPLFSCRPNRRTSMLDILDDTVEQGVTQQPQLHLQPAASQSQQRRPQQQQQRRPQQQNRRPQQQQNRRPQQRWRQRRPHLQKQGRPHVLHSTQPLTAWRRKQNVTEPQHQRHPASRGATESIGAKILRNKNGENENEGASNSKASPSSGPNLQNAQIAPFSLPGRFVNTNRKEPDNITYQFEPPHSGTSQKSHKERIMFPNTKYHPGNPLNKFEYPHRHRRPPITPPRSDVYHFEDSSGERQRPSNIPKGEVNSQKHPSGAGQGRGPNRTSEGNLTRLDPPVELLNPRPNIWRGSGLNQLPSGDQSRLWNQNANQNEGQNILDEDTKRLESPASHATDPLTPTVATTLKSTATDRPVDEATAITSPTGVDWLGYQDVLSALHLGNGVPIKWIPKGKVHLEVKDVDEENS